MGEGGEDVLEFVDVHLEHHPAAKWMFKASRFPIAGSPAQHDLSPVGALEVDKRLFRPVVGDPKPQEALPKGSARREILNQQLAN